MDRKEKMIREGLIENDIDLAYEVRQLPDKKRRIIIDECSAEAAFYFSPDDYDAFGGEKAVEDALLSMSWDGSFTGIDISRFGKGEIKIYFSPVNQGFEDRGDTIKEIVGIIRQMPRR